ncbi:MAG TPA: ABC transporter ATP-binding protein [Candidatus Saccharimonadales bacterium]|nr:ABC transporter ATP-binding protein [Candidatus Saccharimonadales bacterium]
MHDAGAVLVVEGLTAGYNSVPIVKNVKLVARAGEITVLVGPNGAGKSTLLKAVAGVIRPTDGHVMLRGVDVTRQPANRLVQQGLAYVPQLANVFPSLTVMENLEMGGFVRRHGVKEKAEALCQLFPDLRMALKRTARTLSGGQRNMLALARALMVDPAVLLVDEPTAGLSPRYEHVVWEHIHSIKNTGVAVVLVEQNTRRALAECDWGYVLVVGENRLDGPGRDILNNHEIGELYIGKAAPGNEDGQVTREVPE